MLFVADDDSTLSMVTILPRSSGLSGQRHWLDSGMAWLPLVNLLNLNPESELLPFSLIFPRLAKMTNPHLRVGRLNTSDWMCNN